MWPLLPPGGAVKLCAFSRGWERNVNYKSLGQFEVPARFSKFTNFEKARRNPAVSHLTRIVQMSPALSHQLVMAVMLCKKRPLHIFLHSQQVSSVRSPTRPSPSEVPTPHPALYLLDASLPCSWDLAAPWGSQGGGCSAFRGSHGRPAASPGFCWRVWRNFSFLSYAAEAPLPYRRLN